MIRDNKDLRDAYAIVRFIEERGEGPEMRKWVQNQKRKIRAYTHRTSDRKCVWQDSDSYTERVIVPAEVESLEEAEEWFDCMERIEYTPREYDCTGQAFTSWHHIGILGGRMVCWHHVCYDV